jgi:hypothetical protein
VLCLVFKFHVIIGRKVDLKALIVNGSIEVSLLVVVANQPHKGTIVA